MAVVLSAPAGVNMIMLPSSLEDEKDAADDLFSSLPGVLALNVLSTEEGVMWFALCKSANGTLSFKDVTEVVPRAKLTAVGAKEDNA